MNKKIISVGGGAANILAYIGKELGETNNLDLVAINTGQLFKGSKNFKPIRIGQKVAPNGTRRNSELGKEAFYGSFEIFDKLLKGVDQLVLISCFGGGTGSGVVPELVKLLNKSDIQFKSVICMPFNFEKKSVEIADEALREIENNDSSLTVFNLENIFKEMPRENSLKDLFDSVNRCILKIIKSEIKSQ